MVWVFINGLFGIVSCSLAFKFAVEGNVSLTILLCTVAIMFKMNVDKELKDGSD